MTLLASYIFASQIVRKYEWYQLLETVKIVLMGELRLPSSTPHYWYCLVAASHTVLLNMLLDLHNLWGRHSHDHHSAGQRAEVQRH